MKKLPYLCLISFILGCIVGTIIYLSTGMLEETVSKIIKIQRTNEMVENELYLLYNSLQQNVNKCNKKRGLETIRHFKGEIIEIRTELFIGSGKLYEKWDSVLEMVYSTLEHWEYVFERKQLRLTQLCDGFNSDKNFNLDKELLKLDKMCEYSKELLESSKLEILDMTLENRWVVKSKLAGQRVFVHKTCHEQLFKIISFMNLNNFSESDKYKLWHKVAKLFQLKKKLFIDHQMRIDDLNKEVVTQRSEKQKRMELDKRDQ